MSVYYITRQSKAERDFAEATVEEMLEYFSNHTEVQIDTETEGKFDFTNKILLLQIGDFDNQYVINFQELSSKERTLINERILCNEKICKLLHNCKFDIKFFWRHGMDIVNVYDTMLAEIMINAGKNTEKGFYSLYGVAKRYCGVELDKETRGLIHKVGFTKRVIQYAADDVKYLNKIKEDQVKVLVNYGLAKADNLQDELTLCGLEMNAIIAFAEIEYNGMKLDIDKWSSVKAMLHKAEKDAEKEIDKIVIEEPKLSKYSIIYQDLFTPPHKTTSVNWNSSVQKLEVLQTLFSEIKSTDKRTLSRYKSKHPIVSALLNYNKVRKMVSTYADALEGYINSATGRIHTDIWPMVDTGRISSKDPNLLNIPSRTEEGRMMRACFVPEKGYKIVGGDYSGCELRIIAEYSKDPVWLDAFANGKDLHSELCSMTFGIPLSDVKKPTSFKPDLIYRDVQKTIDFGLAYGMSEYKLADEMEVKVDTAAGIINTFFNRVPKVKQFLDMLGELGKSRGFIRTPRPWRRIRWFDGYQNKDDFKRQGTIERAAKNTPIQGCNADIIKYALILLRKEIAKNNWPVKLLLPVYDEVQTECREDKAKEWAKRMSEVMVEATQYSLPTVGMKVDCEVNDYWTK